MRILIKKQRFDFDDDERYPPILYKTGDGSPQEMEEYMKLPIEAFWNAGFTNFHLDYDLKEQIYKKRKSYFHISEKPHTSIEASNLRRRWVAPAAFFAMDVKTCMDYFRLRYEGHPAPNVAFLHHCANVSPMNLFNPDSRADINSVLFSEKAEATLIGLYASGHPHRYWQILERPEIMGPIYNYRGKAPFDGIALNFKNKLSADTDRTEGLCLFQRATRKMDVMRIAVVENPLSSKFDPRNYAYLSPGSVVMNYDKGYYK
jgi:hypothetical protein